jgi:hypothetical protein
MELVYKPGSPDEKRWDVPDDYDLAEIQDLETYSGLTMRQFWDAFDSGRMGLLRPLLYIYLRRTNPNLLYHEVRPKLSEIGIEQSREELEELRAKVTADANWPDRAETLTQLDNRLGALPRDETPGKDEPSQTSPRSGNRASRRSGKPTV